MCNLLSVSFIDDMFKRLWNNRKYILRKSFSAMTLIYAVLGFVRMFVSLEGFFTFNTPLICKLWVSCLILVSVWLFCVIGVSLRVFFTKRRRVVDGQNGKAVFVVYGDLFDESIVANTATRRNVCFAVNRCFDTVVDDHLIASASVHGSAFKRLYSEKVYSPDSLNDYIQKTISSSGFVTLSEKKKPQGNLKRYEVGTAADVPVSDKLHYFLIGLTAFNAELKAETSLSEFCLAIQKMIEFCDSHAQGQPVIMPIVGGFLSRTGQSEKTLLKYIVTCFELNRKHINQDVFIVVRESAKSIVSILDL